MYRYLGLHFSKWAWILWPLKFLMRIEVRPEGLDADRLRAFSKGKHIVYVFPRFYIVDSFVLNLSLGRLKVPRARSELIPGRVRVASVTALKRKPGLIGTKKKSEEFGSLMRKFLTQDKRVAQDQVVLFPVSVFWGRGAEKSGRHPVMRFLFPDDQKATSLQKILMLLVHIRDVNIHFGEPIHPAQLVQEKTGSPDFDLTHDTKLVQDVASKIRRQLQIDFNRERVSMLGPSLYELDDIASWIMRSKETQKFLAEGAVENTEKAHRKILGYLREIAANYNSTTVRTLELLFDFIWTRIFKGVRVRNFERVAQVAKGQQIIWMPCHRSHLDYLLLSYVLFKQGFVCPHIAAGVNLSFWPAGPVLRRGGAFFLRRSISGNRLYSHTFSQYVNFLLHHSFPIEFFQEGGRSRIGKLLSPKMGLLSWCIGSVIRRKAENTYIIPVYFGYDKVMEDDAYARELTGAKKQKESIWQLIASVRYLFSNYGRVDVSFGEPIHFGTAWNSYFSKSENSISSEDPVAVTSSLRDVADDLDTRDLRVQKFVRHVALRVNEKINVTATGSGSAILTTSLLAMSETIIERDRLTNRIGLLNWVINGLRRHIPNWNVATNFGSDFEHDFMLSRVHLEGEEQAKPQPVSVVPIESVKNLDAAIQEIIDDGIRWHFLARKHDEPGLLRKNQTKEMNLWWYRGTIFHVLALPGLVASVLLDSRYSKTTIGVSALIQTIGAVRRVWEEELFWPVEDTDDVLVTGALSVLTDLHLIKRDGDSVFLEEKESALNSLRFLAEIVRPEREIYSIQLAAAENLLETKGEFSKEEVVRLSVSIHRTAFLRGLASQPAALSKVFGTRTFDAWQRSGVFVTQGKSMFTVGKLDSERVREFFQAQSWREFVT